MEAVEKDASNWMTRRVLPAVMSVMESRFANVPEDVLTSVVCWAKTV